MSVEIKKFGNPFKGIETGTYEAQKYTAIKVASKATDLAPVKTGLLKNRIGWKSNKEGNSTYNIGLKPLEFAVIADTNYAVYPEFGTRKSPPNSFLRPSIAIEVKGVNPSEVALKIMRERLKGALSEGVKREQYY